MIIGKVVGEVVCTQKFRTYDRCKILQVQPLDLNGKNKGFPMSAIDLVDAGFGDKVLVCLEGQSAVDAIGLKDNPVDAVILAVIDEIKLVEKIN
jgi:ethanolamine utilization protein EutN